ncbi:MAG: BspA family leucine-rich repeat surface protein [archaeon]|nr:BspA family leucine-rich repeat surface protein [archaeon]
MENLSYNTESPLTEEIKKFYFCPKCKGIPKIRLRSDLIVLINCKCFEKESKLTKETTEKMNLNYEEMAHYKEYQIHLSQFLNIIEKIGQSQKCSKKEIHSEEDKAAIAYCTFCKEFFCEECLNNHNSWNKNNMSLHNIITANGVQLNTLCEEKKGKCSQILPASFYCLDCNLNLCPACKDLHSKHKTVELSSMVDDSTFEKINKEFQSLNEKMNNEDQYAVYEKYFNFVEKQIEKCKMLIEESKKENKQILKYFSTLLETYSSTKDALCFNVRKNLLLNEVNDTYRKIFSYKQQQLRSRVLSKMNINVDDFEKEEKKENFFTAEYEVKDIQKETKLFGDNFNALNERNCRMIIDGEEHPFKKTFQFNKVGKHTIKVEIGRRKIEEGEGIKNEETPLEEKKEESPLEEEEKKEETPLEENKPQTEEEENKPQIEIENKEQEDIPVEKEEEIPKEIPKESQNDLTESKNENNSQSESNPLQIENELRQSENPFVAAKSPSVIFSENELEEEEEIISLAYMFCQCDSLISADLSQLRLFNLVRTTAMFRHCSSLKKVNLNNFRTDNVSDFSSMFAHCSSLTKIDLSSFNTTYGIDFTCMFDCCSSLTKLDLKNFNTKNAVSLNGMFAQCSKLEELNISECNSENVSDYVSMFYNCAKLSKLNWTKFNPMSAVDMSKMFSGCKKLSQPKIPKDTEINIYVNTTEIFQGAEKIGKYIKIAKK